MGWTDVSFLAILGVGAPFKMTATTVVIPIWDIDEDEEGQDIIVSQSDGIEQGKSFRFATNAPSRFSHCREV